MISRVNSICLINSRMFLCLDIRGKRFRGVGTASRVPRVTLALACSEGLYTLSHPVASSLIHIQHQPEHHTYLQLTVPLCYQHVVILLCDIITAQDTSKKNS
jgi:hypothetical protein